MNISEVATQFPTYDRHNISASASLAIESKLSLKTKEGDEVKISFKSEQSLKQSASQSQLEDDGTIREISSVAVAASRYSISVKGNLNDDELAAIQRLVDETGTIAQSFSAQDKLALESATEALTGSLGIFEKIKFKLESVIKATFSSKTSSSDTKAIDPDNAGSANDSPNPVDTDDISNHSYVEKFKLKLKSEFEAKFSSKAFSSDTLGKANDPDNAGSANDSPNPVDTDDISNLSYVEKFKLKLKSEFEAKFSSKASPSDTPVKAIDPDNAGATSDSPRPINTDNIRNLSELIFSAVEAEFESQAAQLPKGEAILRSLNDVVRLLKEQLGELLNPFKNSAEPTLKPPPQLPEINFSSPEEAQA